MTCPDLCTAAKCEELEFEILVLKAQIKELSNVVAEHINQDVYQAHKYNPILKISTNIEDKISHYTQYIDIYLDHIYEFTQVDLPHQQTEPHIMFEIASLNDNNYEFRLNYNGLDYYANLELPSSEPSFVTADIFDLGNNQFNLSVGVDGQFDESYFYVETPEITQLKTNLKGSAFLSNDRLYISIADGISEDTFDVYLPYLTDNDIGDLTQTTFITEQVYMNCDELEQLIINLENNLTNQLNSIENAVTIDISGQVDYTLIKKKLLLGFRRHHVWWVAANPDCIEQLREYLGLEQLYFDANNS